MKAEAPPRLKLGGVSKSFPGVRANDNVHLSVKPGEIHALLGENGAGKSTLVKMIYGVLAPDEGQILFDGAPVRISNPRAARRLGIGMVFQHFSLFEAMTVLENIALGLDSRLSSRELLAEFNRVLETYHLKLDARRIVSTLSVGERQRIEIVRALLLNPSLLIMDEPTSVLTPQEVEQLFETLRRLAASGCSILYISHKLHEIIALCDTATILRGGKVVASCDPKRETSRSMAEMMIGANLKEIAKPAGRVFGPPKLEVQDLSLPKPTEFGAALKDISLIVRAGEIFGVAGVAGNGQNELLSALSGETRAPSAEAVLLAGEAVGRMGVTERRTLGLCAVPEERHGHAAISDFSLTDNASLTGRDRMAFVSFGLINPDKATNYASDVIGAFTVKATGPGALASSLSGGNLQKFIMGREILQRPEALVVCQPTWGVDAGAGAAIHQAIVDLAGRGSAVLVISQDLDELLTLCDTLAVINLGRLSKSLKVGEVSIEEIGLLMGGVHGDPTATIELTEHLHARIRFEKRLTPSRLMLVATPIASVLLTMLLGAIIFELIGFDGPHAIYETFITPIVAPYKWQDVLTKAAPLIMIALGLSLGNQAKIWNIGAEGQYIIGALAGAGVAFAFPDDQGFWAIPLMIAAGIFGGMFWAAIPALLKTRFHVSEVLSSLMLVYVSFQVLNYLIGGPWKDPNGHNFPQTPPFSPSESLPHVLPGTVIPPGFVVAIVLTFVFWLLTTRSVYGFSVRTVGAAPSAARYGGFDASRTIWSTFLISGGMAGLAGILEAMSQLGQINLGFPSGYGFTAIIVSFLGRLHPVGVFLAGLILAVTYVGGQVAQTVVHVPEATAGIFQSMMLFFILASDILVRYRLRVIRDAPRAATAEAPA